MRLIDADELINILCERTKTSNGLFLYALTTMIKLVDLMPTAYDKDKEED